MRVLAPALVSAIKADMALRKRLREVLREEVRQMRKGIGQPAFAKMTA